MFRMNYTKNSDLKKPLKKSESVLITFSTCWYIVKSKFPLEQYLEWIHNLFSIVNNFNLVVYTDIDGYNSLRPLIQTNTFFIKRHKIRFIIKPMEEFYGYRYKDAWMQNHNNSQLTLHKKVDWQLNMLWCEKIHFVNETIRNKYFETVYHGWCDIGYFRNLGFNKVNQLIDWPSQLSLIYNFPNKIHYGCVQTDSAIYNGLKNDVIKHYGYKKNNNNKSNPIPCTKIEEVCFAGGFFILTKPLAEIYGRMFDIKLQYYFQNGFTIKDDQQIIMDCIFTNPQLFQIHFSNDWFMFQELLL